MHPIREIDGIGQDFAYSRTLQSICIHRLNEFDDVRMDVMANPGERKGNAMLFLGKR